MILLPWFETIRSRTEGMRKNGGNLVPILGCVEEVDENEFKLLLLFTSKVEVEVASSHVSLLPCGDTGDRDAVENGDGGDDEDKEEEADADCNDDKGDLVDGLVFKDGDGGSDGDGGGGRQQLLLVGMLCLEIVSLLLQPPLSSSSFLPIFFFCLCR